MGRVEVDLEPPDAVVVGPVDEVRHRIADGHRGDERHDQREGDTGGDDPEVGFKKTQEFVKPQLRSPKSFLKRTYIKKCYSLTICIYSTYLPVL
jgi:hypothetical protein